MFSKTTTLLSFAALLSSGQSAPCDPLFRGKKIMLSVPGYIRDIGPNPIERRPSWATCSDWKRKFIEYADLDFEREQRDVLAAIDFDTLGVEAEVVRARYPNGISYDNLCNCNDLPEKGPYYMSANGNCGEWYNHIESQSDCEKAAAALGLSDRVASDAKDYPDHEIRPDGCYWKEANMEGWKLWFNAEGDKQNNGWLRRSICKRLPTFRPTPSPVVPPRPCGVGELPLAMTKKCQLNGYTCTLTDGPSCCDGRRPESRQCVPCDETKLRKKAGEVYTTPGSCASKVAQVGAQVAHYIGSCDQCGREWCADTWTSEITDTEFKQSYVVGKTMADWGCDNVGEVSTHIRVGKSHVYAIQKSATCSRIPKREMCLKSKACHWVRKGRRSVCDNKPGDYAVQENKFVKWAKCPQELYLCDARDYSACVTEANSKCQGGADCVAFAVYKLTVNKRSNRHVMLYTDSDCNKQHEHHDKHWDMYSSRGADFARDADDSKFPVPIGTAPQLGITGSAFTASAWIYRTGDGSGDFSIFGTDGRSKNNGLHLIVRKSNFYMGFYANDCGSTTPSKLNTWQHVAFVYASGTMKIYVDGEEAKTCTGKDRFTGTGTVNIGQWAGGRKFVGRIRETKIWKRALEQAEIARMALTAKCTSIEKREACLKSDVCQWVRKGRRSGCENKPDYLMHQNKLVTWGKCPQETYLCDARDYSACVLEANSKCQGGANCVAFAVNKRNVNKRSKRQAVLYTDSDCNKQNEMKWAPAWDMYTNKGERRREEEESFDTDAPAPLNDYEQDSFDDEQDSFAP